MPLRPITAAWIQRFYGGIEQDIRGLGTGEFGICDHAPLSMTGNCITVVRFTITYECDDGTVLKIRRVEAIRDGRRFTVTDNMVPADWRRLSYSMGYANSKPTIGNYFRVEFHDVGQPGKPRGHHAHIGRDGDDEGKHVLLSDVVPSGLTDLTPNRFIQLVSKFRGSDFRVWPINRK